MLVRLLNIIPWSLGSSYAITQVGGLFLFDPPIIKTNAVTRCLQHGAQWTDIKYEDVIIHQRVSMQC